MTSSAPASRVVELAGLPGSGKTTLAAVLRGHLFDAGVPCTIEDAPVSAASPRHARVTRRAGYALREAVRAPAAARRATAVLAGSGQAGPRDTAAVLAQWLATEHVVARSRRGPGVHLLEEGPVQAAWTAALRARRLRVDELWACLPAHARTDMVLHLDVRPERAAHRLAARASLHSRTQRLRPDDRLEELRSGRHLMEEILETCPIPVVSLTAAEPVETLAGLATAAVLRMTPHSVTPRSPDLR
jgi:thymidylate kinase